MPFPAAYSPPMRRGISDFIESYHFRFARLNAQVERIIRSKH